jgi:aminoglycoside phosphotransferase family enzyme/predicted kinase
MARPSEIEPLPDGLPDELERPEALPEDPPPAQADVEHVQTHLSHVFLSPGQVYKLHKAVDLGFVSFATRAERNDDCLRELRLNRRLAEDVYRGVAAVRRDPETGRHRLGPVETEPEALDPAREHCVVMRRLAEEDSALARLERGALGRAELERVAERLAVFHAEAALGAPAPFDAEAWRGRMADPALANYDAMEGERHGLDPEHLRTGREATEAALDRLAPDFERRRVAGRAVDGHGDLHLQHVFLEREGPPRVIDCIAFSEPLRRIDAASDVAFLAMDLGYRGHADLGEHFLAAWTEATGDLDAYSVLDFFVSYRAAVRAKVAALAAADPDIPEAQRGRARESAARHLGYAIASLAPREPGTLVLVGGTVGTGKSTVARALERRAGGVILASDRVRRRLPGMDEAPRHGAWGEGRYAPEQRQRVYDAMLGAAAPALRAGRTVILDATWSSHERRDRARERARQAGSRCCFVETVCPREVTLARLAERAMRGTDPSEAGPEHLDAMTRSFEPVEEWPAEDHFVVDTSAPDWEAALEPVAEAVRSAPPRAALEPDRPPQPPR